LRTSERCQPRIVCGVTRNDPQGDLAGEHGQLVAQNKDLGILGRSIRPVDANDLEHASKRTVEEGQGHDGSLTEGVLAGQSRSESFWTLHQQARNVCMELAEHAAETKFLIRDRDTKFSTSFDAVFVAENIRIIKTPVRAPRANALAERFVGTIRRECLYRMLVLGRRHLEVVLAEYVEHYNSHRPHRSLGQRAPYKSDTTPALIGDVNAEQVQRTDVLGRLIHEYRLVV
jgi:hypothetical protein